MAFVDQPRSEEKYKFGARNVPGLKCGPLPIYLTSPRDFSLKALIPFSVREKIRAKKRAGLGFAALDERTRNFLIRFIISPYETGGKRGKCVSFFSASISSSATKGHTLLQHQILLYHLCLAKSAYSTYALRMGT